MPLLASAPDSAESGVVVTDLTVSVRATSTPIVENVSFRVAAGEVVALVGESGSGKTTVGLALLGEERPGCTISGGAIRLAGSDILKLESGALRRLRGRGVAYVPQHPATALNPALRVGVQLREVLDAHDFGASSHERHERVREVLSEVLLQSDDAFLRRYPHQLSGGQQQRVALAMAFACRPNVIVLDEPTTGLDVTTQAHVLDTIRRLCGLYGVAALYITHDLAVVSHLADRVIVMYAGRVVEIARTKSVLARSAHPYSRALIRAIPRLSVRQALVGLAGHVPAPGERPTGCTFAPRCTRRTDLCTTGEPRLVDVGNPEHVARCFYANSRSVQTAEPPPATWQGHPPGRILLAASELHASYGQSRILHDLDLRVRAHECLAIVGESGSGKTTLARCLIGLHPRFGGEIAIAGRAVRRGARERDIDSRRALQYIFQSPYDSLNPRRTIRQILTVPLAHFFSVSGRRAEQEIHAALDRVSLPLAVANRRPSDLSGGELQRIAIARALLCQPEVLLCDEITSALDVSMQAAILALLRDLQRDMGLGLLFITHDLALVRAIADRVAVIERGRIVEEGRLDQVLDYPTMPYTKALLAASASIDVPAGVRHVV